MFLGLGLRVFEQRFLSGQCLRAHVVVHIFKWALCSSNHRNGAASNIYPFKKGSKPIVFTMEGTGRVGNMLEQTFPFSMAS